MIDKHLVVDREHPEQRRIEQAGLVALGRREELVLEAEAVEEVPQHRVVMVRKALELAERVGHVGQRLIQMLRSISWFGTFVGTLRSPSMSSEKQMSRVSLAFGKSLKGVAHHGRACDLAERADVRQPRRSVAGLEQSHLVLAAWNFIEPGNQPPRLLERPSLGGLSFGEECDVEFGHGFFFVFFFCVRGSGNLGAGG